MNDYTLMDKIKLLNTVSCDLSNIKKDVLNHKPGYFDSCETFYDWDNNNAIDDIESDLTMLDGFVDTIVPAYELGASVTRSIDKIRKHIKHTIEKAIINNDLIHYQLKLFNSNIINRGFTKRRYKQLKLI